MNIFLTGGTGFIGSYVAMAPVNAGYNATILARNNKKIPALNTITQINIIEGDITDKRVLQRCIPGNDAVILIALNYTRDSGHEVLIDDTLPTVWLYEC